MCLRSLVVAVVVGMMGAGPAPAAPRNVVLFVADDHGQDAGCYGNKVLKTPHLDALAADGTLFRNAFCTTASCSPSRSVILTGQHNHATWQYGLQHSYHHFSSRETLKSLPVMLEKAGYRTGRAGKYHVAPEAVYHFDTAIPGPLRNPVALADRCRDFLTARDERPFFLFFCTADPHRSGTRADDRPGKPDRFGNRPGGYPGVTDVKYDPKDVIVPPFLPDTPACREELAQYYQSVSRVDQGLGRLVKVLKDAGKWDDTLFIYISDHGIPFPGAKTTVYDPGLKSPCVVRHPGLKRRGVVNGAMVSWVDLTPTILDFARATPKTARFHGRSFLPILGEEAPKGWDEVYASHTFHEVTMYYPCRVVRTRRYKYILNLAHKLDFPFASDLYESATWQDVLKRGLKTYGKRAVKDYISRPREELYDLENDPDEVKNLAGQPRHAKLLEEMRRKCKDFQTRTNDPWVIKYKHE